MQASNHIRGLLRQLYAGGGRRLRADPVAISPVAWMQVGGGYFDRFEPVFPTETG